MSAKALGLVILILSFAVAGQIADWKLLNQIAMALLVSMIVAYCWSRIAIGGLDIDRVVSPSRLQVEHVLDDDITLRNNSIFGKLWIELRDATTLPGHDAGTILGMRRKSAKTWTTRSICVRRGSYLVGPLSARAGDPLDIFAHHKSLGGEQHVIGYPPTFDLPGLHLPAKDLSGGSPVDRRSHLTSPSIATVREYVPGDPMNRIAWHLTARNGTLLVKDFELDPTAEIYLLADFAYNQNVKAPIALRDLRNQGKMFSEQWMDTSEDYVASITASVAQIALNTRRAVGLISTMQPRQIMSPARSDVHLVKMLEELAVSVSNGSEPMAEMIARESHRFDRLRIPIVVTASTDESWLDALETLTSRGIRPIAIFIDPLSFTTANQTSAFVSAMAQKPFDAYSVDYRQGIEGSFASQQKVRADQWLSGTLFSSLRSPSEFPA